MIKKLILILALVGTPVGFAWADGHAKTLSPAALEQVTIANKLISLGNARKDALLLIAAAHMRANLSDDAIETAADLPTTADGLESAKKFARGRQDYLGMIEDIKASKSKGCSVRYGCQNPYTN